MARIVVFRDGEVVDRIAVDPSTLSARDLRIGRDQGSDIVLDDPAKTVSRQHAELRFDQGEYVLFDLGSPNGTWVGNERVQRVVLTEGGRVRIGTYELCLEKADAKQAQMPEAPVTETVKTSQTIKAVGGAPPLITGSAVPYSLGARLGSKQKRSKPVGSDGVPQPGAIAWLARQPKPVVFGGVLTMLVLVIGLRAMLTPVEDGAVTPEVVPLSETSTNKELIAELLADARAALGQGEFKDAIEYLDRVLLIDRSHPDALDIKARVEQGFIEPPIQPVDEEVSEENSAAAVEAAAAEAERVRRQRVVAQGAREREAELAGQLAETRALLDAQEFSEAIRVLEGILQGAPDHEVATALIATAQDAMTVAARAAFDRAVRAEGGGNWEEAIEEYEHAQALDGTMFGVDAAVRRVRERMAEAGADAYKRARQYDALGRIPEAIALYERASRLLPSDHAERQPAQERFRELSSGGR